LSECQDAQCVPGASADVNNASVTSPNVLVGKSQDANSYDLAVLEWKTCTGESMRSTGRDRSPGDVWASGEPVSYPIKNITVTASSSLSGYGSEKTIDGRG
jgi:hypothetical protein